MATFVLEQDLGPQSVTSPKLANNISIAQTLTVGTDTSIGGALGIGTTLNVGTTATVGTDLTVNNSAFVAGNLTVQGLIQDTSAVLSFLSGVVDSASAVAFDFNTTNLINDLGSRLLRIRNQGTEVFAVDGYGNVFADGYVSTESGLVTSPFTALRFSDVFASTEIPLSDTANRSLPSGRVSLLDAIANAGTVTDLDTAYDGTGGSGAGRSVTVDSGPVSLQRNFAGSTDPLLEIGDGYTLNALELLADGTIVGGNSPFVFRSRESDTIGGSAFRFDTSNTLTSTANLLRLRNLTTDILSIKADGDHDFGTGLAPRFTATPPNTVSDDTAFIFNTLAPNFDDSILRLEHGSTEKFHFDGYGILDFGSGTLSVGIRDGYTRFFSTQSQVVFKNSVGEFLTASGANLSLSSPLSNQNEIILDGTGDNKIQFISGVVNSPASTGFIFDTRNNLNLPGSKLVSVRSAGMEVGYIDGYGNIFFNDINSASGNIFSTSSLQFRDSLTPSPIPLADPLHTILPPGIDSILDGLTYASNITLDTAYDGYGIDGYGRHIFADSGPVHIVVPDSYTNNGLEITKGSTSDGYALQIANNSNRPSIYIDQVAGPSITFAKDNQNDIGRFQANRPRSLYVGTQVVVGNSIRLDTSSLISSDRLQIQVPGSNTADSSESPALDIRITGQKTLLKAYEEPLFRIRNFNTNVFRIDGYGSIYLGDTTDGYGLDASRIVFNANRFNTPASPGTNDDAGLIVERGSASLPAKLYWDESDRLWKADLADGLPRNITPLPITVELADQTVCQDEESLQVNARNAWARALIHKINVDTSCPDYDLEIYDNRNFAIAARIFRAAHLNGNLDSRTSLYYEEQDGYNELHYKIINYDSSAHVFDSYVRAEVFYAGQERVYVETFENGDFCAPLGPELFSESDFSDSIFTATVGSTLLSESFDAYGVFDAYGGPILSSDDMNSLGF